MGNPTVLRMLRFVRLVRLLRVLRSVRFLDPLYLLLKAIQSSMSVLVWTVLMLLILMMAIAMVNHNMLTGFMWVRNMDDKARINIYESWGSFIRAYVTMFEIT